VPAIDSTCKILAPPSATAKINDRRKKEKKALLNSGCTKPFTAPE
jgi:hypothetical protein